MAVLTKTPPNEDAARRVVGARWAAAEPRVDILPTGRPLRDTRRYAWTSECEPKPMAGMTRGAGTGGSLLRRPRRRRELR